jgi:hypothetical protein
VPGYSLGNKMRENYTYSIFFTNFQLLSLFVLFIGASEPPLTEVQQIFRDIEKVQESKPENERFEAINLVDSEGFNFKLYPDLILPDVKQKNCFRSSALLRDIYEDKNAFTQKKFYIPVSLEELAKFLEFCINGGNYQTLKEYWNGDLDLGYHTLDLLRFSFPGCLNRVLIFRLLNGQQIFVKDSLLCRLLNDPQRNSFLKDAHSKEEKIHVNIPMELSFPEDEISIILKLSVLAPFELRKKGMNIVMPLLLKNKDSIMAQAIHRIVEKNVFIELVSLSKILMADTPPSPIPSYILNLQAAFLELREYGGEGMPIDEEDIITNFITSLRSEVYTEPYQAKIQRIASMYFLQKQLAPLFGYPTFNKRLDDLFRKIKPNKPSDLIQSVDNKMLFIKLGLLIQYIELGHEEWIKQNLANLAMLILEWSRSLHQQKESIDRREFAQEIFNAFLKDLSMLGATRQQLRTLQESIRI